MLATMIPTLPDATPYERSYKTLRIAERLLGGRRGLANACGIAYSTVCYWHYRKHFMPLEYVPLVVAACNDPRVTPQNLRPDYPHWEMLGRQLRQRDERPETPESIAA